MGLDKVDGLVCAPLELDMTEGSGVKKSQLSYCGARIQQAFKPKNHERRVTMSFVGALLLITIVANARGGFPKADEPAPAPETEAPKPAPKRNSKIPLIEPDKEAGPIKESKRAELEGKYGAWHFWDGDVERRPQSGYAEKFPNKDIPGDDFPNNAWQTDAVYVNHYLNDVDWSCYGEYLY